MSDPLRLRLDSYRAAYACQAVAADLDAGVRSADAHVAAHDPLQGRVGHPRWPALAADVALGVEPGTYFCAGLAHALAASNAPRRVGFIHVPPDAALPRPALLDLLGEVVAGVLAALGAEASGARVLLTGFGPFPGVPDNPTAAFVQDPRRVAQAAGGRAAAAVLWLAAPDGSPYEEMGPVVRQLAAAVEAHAPDIVLALGVDSRQALPRPRFTIETQSRGMRERRDGCMHEPGVSALHLDDVPLAVLRSGAFQR